VDPLTTKAIATAAAGAIAPEAKGLLSRLLGPAFDELGLMLRDPIAARRQRNLERLAAKAARRVPEHSPAVPPLPLRTVIQLLEGALLHALNRETHGVGSPWTTIMRLGEASDLSGDGLMETLDNLFRLRLCILTVPQTGEAVRRSDVWPMTVSRLELTVLGRRFLKACTGSGH